MSYGGVKTNKNRGRRVYHRMSTFTPDQQSFMNYLIQRGFKGTLKVFEEEIRLHEGAELRQSSLRDFLNKTTVTVS